MSIHSSNYSEQLRNVCELGCELRIPHDHDKLDKLACLKCHTVGQWEVRTGYAKRCAGKWLYKVDSYTPSSVR